MQPTHAEIHRFCQSRLIYFRLVSGTPLQNPTFTLTAPLWHFRKNLPFGKTQEAGQGSC